MTHRAVLAIIAVCGLLAVAAVAWSRRAAPSQSTDRAILLRVADWAGPANDPAFLSTERKILLDFERNHPDVRVRVEHIPGPGQYVPKLLMTCVAGNPPDVLWLDASSAAVFVDNNLLLDLTPRLGDLRLEDYFSNVMDIARRGPRLYAIPLDFTPMVILYNKRIFDAAGIAYPRPGWTRDEFLATAKALMAKAPPPCQYAIHFEKDMPMWFPWIWAGGGDVLSPDARRAGGFLDGDPTIDTIQFLIDLIRVHRAAPSLSESSAMGLDLFRAGKAAMRMTGHWSLVEYKNDGMDLGIASIPRARLADSTLAPRSTVMYAASMAISAQSPHKEAAWAYVKHMTSPEVQRTRLVTGLAISGNRKAAMSFAGNPVEDAFLEEVNYARPPWGARCERYELVEDLGREMIEDILNGNIPVRQAVSRMARLVDAELSRQ